MCVKGTVSRLGPLRARAGDVRSGRVRSPDLPSSPAAERPGRRRARASRTDRRGRDIRGRARAVAHPTPRGMGATRHQPRHGRVGPFRLRGVSTPLIRRGISVRMSACPQISPMPPDVANLAWEHGRSGRAIDLLTRENDSLFPELCDRCSRTNTPGDTPGAVEFRGEMFANGPVRGATFLSNVSS